MEALGQMAREGAWRQGQEITNPHAERSGAASCHKMRREFRGGRRGVRNAKRGCDPPLGKLVVGDTGFEPVTPTV